MTSVTEEMKHELSGERLLPCPFGCAENPHITGARETFVVICMTCSATGPEENSREEAIAAWNRRSRPAEAKADAEIERIEAATTDMARRLGMTYVPDPEKRAAFKAAISSALEPVAEAKAEPVGWVPQEHLDFLQAGRDANTPSSAIVHDRPNEEMGWTIPLFASPVAQQRDELIEECAKIAEEFVQTERYCGPDANERIAARIRALSPERKDQSNG